MKLTLALFGFVQAALACVEVHCDYENQAVLLGSLTVQAWDDGKYVCDPHTYKNTKNPGAGGGTDNSWWSFDCGGGYFLDIEGDCRLARYRNANAGYQVDFSFSTRHTHTVTEVKPHIFEVEACGKDMSPSCNGNSACRTCDYRGFC